MPCHARGPYLWLRPARQRARGSDPALWIIRDAGHQHSTGFSVGDRGEAERRLAEYIAGKYAPARRGRDIAEIPVADVISIYLADVAPNQARPEKAAERCGKSLSSLASAALAKSLAPIAEPMPNGAAPMAAHDATFKTLLQQSAIMPRRACTAASSESPCRLKGVRASDGSRATRLPASCGLVGAIARFKTAGQPTSGRCATWPAYS